MIVMILVGIIVGLLLLSIVAILAFAGIYLFNVARYSFIDDPLNMHHPSFVFLDMLDASGRWTVKNAFLSYRVLLLIPILMLVCGIGIAITYYKNRSQNMGGMDMAILALIGGPIALLALTAGVLATTTGMVKSDVKAIQWINNTIRSKMHNGSEFNKLGEDRVTRLQQIALYQTLLGQLKTDNATEYAKALFTINMYLVMYDMGSKHANIDDALQPFKNVNRLGSTKFARFLSPKNVEIPNRLAEILLNRGPSTNVSEAVQQEAVTLATRWISDINSKLSDLTYSSVSFAFITVTVIMLLIYMAVFKLFIMYKNM